jgi:hypothetical protein
VSDVGWVADEDSNDRSVAEPMIDLKLVRQNYYTDRVSTKHDVFLKHGFLAIDMVGRELNRRNCNSVLMKDDGFLKYDSDVKDVGFFLKHCYYDDEVYKDGLMNRLDDGYMSMKGSKNVTGTGEKATENKSKETKKIRSRKKDKSENEDDMSERGKQA